MENIKFVSHQKFPDDPYTKELVYLCLDDKYRVAYVRKQAKNGGLFWGVPSVTVSRGDGKAYCPAFMMDSSFLKKDIEDFLEQRSWEKTNVSYVRTAPYPENEELPF